MPNQNQGVGYKILLLIEKQIKIVERNLWTVVSSFNLKGRNFYKRAGFLEIALLSGLIKSDYDEILLRKEIVNLNG
jgi:hypothetical protein